MEKIKLPEMKVVGLKVRSSYTDELNFATSKIFPCVQTYFHQNIAQSIKHRKKPGTTLCCYTEYENGHLGAYTYFIGEEVTSFEDNSLEHLLIPAQTYAKFTSGPGAMPDVIKKPWQAIWEMSDLKRAFKTDFEVYDERSSDHEKIILDIYVGVI